jgi:hypothetical protein
VTDPACTCTDDPARLTWGSASCPVHKTPDEVATARHRRVLAPKAGDVTIRVVAVECVDCGAEIKVVVSPERAETIPHFIAQVVAAAEREHDCPKKGQEPPS